MPGPETLSGSTTEDVGGPDEVPDLVGSVFDPIYGLLSGLGVVTNHSRHCRAEDAQKHRNDRGLHLGGDANAGRYDGTDIRRRSENGE